MVEEMTTSHSEVESYLKCQRNHYYGYGLRLEPVKMSDALARGIIGHAGLAAYYRNRKDGGEHEDGVKLAIQEMIIEAENLTTYNRETLLSEAMGLVRANLNHFENDEWEVIEVEKRYDVEIMEGYTMPVIIDLIVRIPGRGVIVVDHKFTYDFYSSDAVDLNPQLAKYLAVMRTDGYEVHGAMYNQIRYRTTKANAKEAEERFSRVIVSLTSKRVSTVMREQIMVAQRIAKLKRMEREEWESRVVRVANSMVCKSCSFKDLCASDLNGQNSELLIQYEYKEKTRRDRNS